jgi:two-component system, NarL family, invasion response regulator UvrY
MINVFIADDHELVRETLKKILQCESDIKVVGEAKNAIEVLDKMHKTECDILVLDLNMPGRCGLDLILDLKLQKPQLRILILSIYPEEIYALRALKAGANGYVNKDAALTELVIAFRRIHSHGKYLSDSLTEQLAFDLCTDKVHLPHEYLSNREFEIMRMIASNKKTTEIASDLSLSINTINTYRTHIFEKMQLNSNVELTQYAMNAKLVD